jgi:hypothetical protein
MCCDSTWCRRLLRGGSLHLAATPLDRVLGRPEIPFKGGTYQLVFLNFRGDKTQCSNFPPLPFAEIPMCKQDAQIRAFMQIKFPHHIM